MISIRIQRQKDGMRVAAVGHAGLAPRGYDPVCAGVSALLYGYIAYLEGLSPVKESGREAGLEAGQEEKPHLERVEGDGYLTVTTRGLRGADLFGWQVTEAGLRLIRSAYPTCLQIGYETASGPKQSTGGKKRAL